MRLVAMFVIVIHMFFWSEALIYVIHIGLVITFVVIRH